MRHFRIAVSVNGDEVIAIETEMLAGAPNVDDYADEIRYAAESLLAFIGPENPEPFLIEDDE